VRPPASRERSSAATRAATTSAGSCSQTRTASQPAASSRGRCPGPSPPRSPASAATSPGSPAAGGGAAGRSARSSRRRTGRRARRAAGRQHGASGWCPPAPRRRRSAGRAGAAPPRSACRAAGRRAWCAARPGWTLAARRGRAGCGTPPGEPAALLLPPRGHLSTAHRRSPGGRCGALSGWRPRRAAWRAAPRCGGPCPRPAATELRALGVAEGRASPAVAAPRATRPGPSRTRCAQPVATALDALPDGRSRSATGPPHRGAGHRGGPAPRRPPPRSLRGPGRWSGSGQLQPEVLPQPSQT